MNKMYKRTLIDIISNNLYKGKIIILYGARQVGKTTLLKQILEEQKKLGKKVAYFSCDLISIKSKLETINEQTIKDFFGDNDLILLDEAQTINQIGLLLKIIVDTYPNYQIIATGSSSFELSNQIGEPLVGRNRQFKLYSLSVKEITEKYNMFDVDAKIENILRFGTYPGIIDLPENEKIMDLDTLTSNYLFKDILAYDNIRNSSIILKLLKLLALQLGNEVSFNELAGQLGISSQTVKKYIDLLEKNFIVFTINSFSRNLRKELNKSVKIYFYDLGIRNALINNFNTLENRNDIGGLWKNFCIVERMKFNQYNNKFVNSYFWRTYQGEEIDYLEEYNGNLFAYEIKYKKDDVRFPKSFLDTYKNVQTKVVNKNNWTKFLIDV